MTKKSSSGDLNSTEKREKDAVKPRERDRGRSETRDKDRGEAREQARSEAREQARQVAKKILNFRGATRFRPDPLTIASVRFDTRDLSENKSWDFVALVANESFTGCAIVVIQAQPTKAKDVVIKVGELAPMKAKIVWQKQLEENIFKIGIQYL